MWYAGEMISVYMNFGGKISFGRLELRWGHNIKIELQEIGLDGLDWVRLVLDRVKWRAYVSMVQNRRVA